MDGILRCSRYSFGPNRLHYCGPDANAELRDYIKSGTKDSGLEILLKQFRTLYPYLMHIAEANGIKNPFDSRVVEAYWLGNRLLEAIQLRNFHRLMKEGHDLKKKMGGKEFSRVEEKLARGAVPHHSFHVFNIWNRTGNMQVPHTLESMDECRVSSGTVISVDGPNITVSTEPLVYVNGKLALGAPVQKTLTRALEATYDIEQIRTGQTISIHWSVPCEVITPRQSATLKKYTLQNIAFANQTI